MIARAGLMLSGVGHAGVVCCVLLLLSQPRPFQALPEQALMVDVVTPQEIARTPPASQDQPQREQPPAPASQGAQEGGDPGAQSSSSAASGAAAQQPLPNALPSVSASMLSIYNMRLPGDGFDAKSDRQADLDKNQLAAFRAHLKKCWRQPDGLAPASRARVVLRVALTPGGALAAEPTLVEATASAEGPAVFRAAVQAVEACQPYSFLPAERYSEWKVLDVPFSPREMAGG